MLGRCRCNRYYCQRSSSPPAWATHLCYLGRQSYRHAVQLPSTIKLFFTNDDGVFLYDPKEASAVVEIDTEEDREKLMTQFKNGTVKVLDGRLKTAPEGVLSHMQWNTNKPGMTVFMPIVDFTVEYVGSAVGGFPG